MSYPPQGNPYGSMPGYGQTPPVPMPPGYPPAGEVPQRPSSVTTAVSLMFARVALMALGVILSFVMAGEILEQVTSTSGVPGGDAFIGQAMTMGLIFAAIVNVVILVLYGLLAVQVRQGRDWARIVTWVVSGLFITFAVIGLLGQLVFSTSPFRAPLITTVLAVIMLAIDIAVVTLLALRPSNAYFARRGHW